MDVNAECVITLGCKIADESGNVQEFNEGNHYEWSVPAAKRKEVPTWTVGQALTQILESYAGTSRSAGGEVHMYVMRKLLEGVEKFEHGGAKYKLTAAKGFIVNDKPTDLSQKIERYARYYPELGNVFKIEVCMTRESGA